MSARYPGQVIAVISLAQNVLDQGGNFFTRLGGNCPMIGQVIDDAIYRNPNENLSELRELRRKLLEA